MIRHPLTVRLLETLEATRGRTLLAFDFDGTLVSLRTDPKRVELTPEWRRLLGRLAKRFDVAIISGRGLADLQKKMKGLRVHLAASHGFEIVSRDGIPLSKGRAVWRRSNAGWMTRLQEKIDARPELRGAWIEDKSFSCTLHFRSTADPARAERVLTKLARDLRPRPDLVAGIFVLNLVPPIAPHKGQALRKLRRATQQRAAFFAGDDVTDENVFELPDRGLVTVRVGDNGRPTAAQFALPNRAALFRVLESTLR